MSPRLNQVIAEAAMSALVYAFAYVAVDLAGDLRKERRRAREAQELDRMVNDA
jgi:hypothetical protein